MSPAFSPGSVSLGVPIYDDLRVSDQVSTFIDEVSIAEDLGFDGVTVSEHHNGFPGYIPASMLAVNWALGATSRMWLAPCPVLLPLRNPRLLAEEVAWSSARFGPRFALGLAPGYLPSDFSLVGITPDDRAPLFHARLDEFFDALSGGDPVISSDKAIKELDTSSLVVLSAAGSRTAARRAATHDMGIILGSHTDSQRRADMIESYKQEGGSGPIVRIRRVWVGDDPPIELIQRQLSMYEQAASTPPAWMDSAEAGLTFGDPGSIVESLKTDLEADPTAAVNIRIHTPGLKPSRVQAQMREFADQILPGLRNYR